ncbi:helix-turn-helix domain-containing protein [Streptomyces sp. DSM 44917]|uniref:Helix-turn-helix domain-containing protein n=1 Tax=Streptomyces boetiae TaxID=3075541 RepID=A0ABU2L7T0_9ACTN|nr:helix-turn-helix domain-containing protein [Streptomyces sp. DSM 44917]MDT0307634.1 helix-turn-helix domain-containing protein [Streptomyces sp. DSM 44917]
MNRFPSSQLPEDPARETVTVHCAEHPDGTCAPKGAEPTPPAGAPQLYRVSDAVALLNLSRSVLYDLIRTGRLRTVSQGRSRRIPAKAIREYVALLEREAERPR